MSNIRRVSFEEAKRIMDENPDFVMIDVRDEAEFISGHASDAVLLPVDDFNEETVEELVPSLSTPVLVYCRSGARSARAALLLEEYGYEHIYDIGGLSGWPYGML